VTRQAGEDVLLRARVCGIVADHEEIEDRIFDEFPGPRAVVDRNSREADLSLFPQLRQLFLYSVREAVGPVPMGTEVVEMNMKMELE
jgi:hypothetical protein